MSAHLVKAMHANVARHALLKHKINERAVLLSLTNNMWGRKQIGKREVVGFGINGSYAYFDKPDFPFPAIRFREDDEALKQLRVKEKGDWKQLTIADKKKLYRASFCSTIAEAAASTGEWKSIIAGVIAVITTGLWVYVFLKKCVYGPLPESMTMENKKKMLRDYIILRIDPIQGISSKWDYEKNRWKE